MTKQEKIADLYRELDLAENYPFNRDRYDVAEALVERGYGNVKQAAKSAVRDFITRLSYVRKSIVDDDGEPVVTVGVVNFDDMVDMFHELYGADE